MTQSSQGRIQDCLRRGVAQGRAAHQRWPCRAHIGAPPPAGPGTSRPFAAQAGMRRPPASASRSARACAHSAPPGRPCTARARLPHHAPQAAQNAAGAPGRCQGGRRHGPGLRRIAAASGHPACNIPKADACPSRSRRRAQAVGASRMQHPQGRAPAIALIGGHKLWPVGPATAWKPERCRSPPWCRARP